MVDCDLLDACRRGDLETVQRSLVNGVDLAGRINSLLTSAAYYGHLPIVECLLQDPRVNPSNVGSREAAIVWAVDGCHLEVVKRLLLDERVDPSIQDNAAILMAAKRGCLDIVEVLLVDNRVSVTPDAIEFAAWCGHATILQKLLCDYRVDATKVPIAQLQEMADSRASNNVREVIRTWREDVGL